jgi:hypothetical protein
MRVRCNSCVPECSLHFLKEQSFINFFNKSSQASSVLPATTLPELSPSRDPLLCPAPLGFCRRPLARFRFREATVRPVGMVDVEETGNKLQSQMRLHAEPEDAAADLPLPALFDRASRLHALASSSALDQVPPSSLFWELGSSRPSSAHPEIEIG